jgi:hypothetical protein
MVCEEYAAPPRPGWGKPAVSIGLDATPALKCGQTHSPIKGQFPVTAFTRHVNYRTLKNHMSESSGYVREIAMGTIGLAALVHSDTQVGRNDLFKIIQGIAHLRKHTCARRFAEELRDSDHNVGSFDLHTKVSHEIKSAKLA